MTNATTIQGFPKRKLAAARHALDLAYNRLAKSAVRTGQEPPAAPEIVVLREVWVSRCTVCKCEVEGVAGGHCLAPRCGGVYIARECVDLEVRSPRPTLAGWDFLAVVEPMTGGNLIRQVPYAEVADGELDPWRTGDTCCDHCKTSRYRKETFVVRADGSDPSVPAGTYKQVGRNCLEAFLGGKSAAAIIAALGWANVVRSEGDGEGGSFDGGDYFEMNDFLGWVASSARIAGFVTRTQARERSMVDGTQSTSDHALYLITWPGSNFTAQARWKAAREKFAPTDDDKARAKAALEWAASITPSNDYEQNLSLIAKQPALERKHAGILASAISAHARKLGEDLRRANRAPSKPIGAVGEKLELAVTIEKVIAVPSDYSDEAKIITMRDAEGNAIVWRTSVAIGVAGDSFTIRGTVKRHSEFKGEQQTELTRCKKQTNA